MMMRKLILIVLTTAVLVTGFAFGAGQAEDAPPKVAGVVFQEDQFMRLLQMGYQDAAEAAGFEFFPGNTNGDAARESEFLNTYVTQGYAGVAISPISEEASLRVLEQFSNEGLLIGVSNHEFSMPFFTGAYTSDNYTLGASVGQAARTYIEEELGGSAKVAVLQFRSLLPEQSSARSSGFLDQMDGLDVEVVTDQDAWMQDVAIEVGGDIITAFGGDIDLIFAANEGGTIGATMAVKNAGLEGEIVVFGFDGSEQIVQLLQDPANILQAAIAQDPYMIGVRTMESVVDAINNDGTSSTQGQSFIVPGILLERANPAGLQQFVTDLREKTGS
jgi:sugar transport system substrate-binding protein